MLPTRQKYRQGPKGLVHWHKHGGIFGVQEGLTHHVSAIGLHQLLKDTHRRAEAWLLHQLGIRGIAGVLLGLGQEDHKFRW
jgi:hypothetical protein